jgi:hypothetical protein
LHVSFPRLVPIYTSGWGEASTYRVCCLAQEYLEMVWVLADSNPQHSDYESSTLTINPLIHPIAILDR